MVERVLEQSQAIKRVFAQDKSRRPLPQLTWQDLSVLEAVKNGLKPVADFTDILSGENYVTVSSLLPMLLHLRELLEESEDDARLTADLKRVILEQMEHKYDNAATLRILHKAALLDPRYRGDHMEPPELNRTKTELVAEMVAATPARERPVGPAQRIREEEEDEALPPSAPKKSRGSLGSLLGKKVAKAATLTADQKAEAEITAYLQEEAIEGENDPLTWWKANQMRFPLMASIARKYLCICATSTPSERVFSTAGSVVTPVRSLLKPEKVNMLVFLARNL